MSNVSDVQALLSATEKQLIWLSTYILSVSSSEKEAKIAEALLKAAKEISTP